MNTIQPHYCNSLENGCASGAKILLICGIIATLAAASVFFAMSIQKLPSIFSTTKQAFWAVGATSLLSATFLAVAISFLKSSRQKKLEKAAQYLIKNYRLVDTNITGNDICEMLKSAKAILFGEIHQSKFCQEKNKFVVEALWNSKSFFLSEDGEVVTYGLDEAKIQKFARWDIDAPEEDELDQFQKDLMLFAKCIVKWEDFILEERTISKEAFEFMKDSLGRELYLTVSGSRQFDSLKQIFETLSQEANKCETVKQLKKTWCQLYIDWFGEMNNQIINFFPKRQESLANQVIEYTKNNIVFLIAGMDHLMHFENGKIVADAVVKKIKETEIPYIVLYPKKKMNGGDESIFWQRKLKTQHTDDRFDGIDNYLTEMSDQQKREYIKNPDKMSSNLDKLKYLVMTYDVLSSKGRSSLDHLKSLSMHFPQHQKTDLHSQTI